MAVATAPVSKSAMPFIVTIGAWMDETDITSDGPAIVKMSLGFTGVLPSFATLGQFNS